MTFLKSTVILPISAKRHIEEKQDIVLTIKKSNWMNPNYFIESTEVAGYLGTSKSGKRQLGI